MIKQEEIKLETRRKGTQIKFFTTYSGQTSESGDLSFLITNPITGNYTVVDSLIDTVYKRNSENNFVINNKNDVFTGSTILQTSESLTPKTKLKVSNKYIAEINNKWKEEVGLNPLNIPPPFSFVEFQEIELNDLYINLQITRSIDSLDTLSIFNTPIGEQALQESSTGVVFGRLVAQQNVLDENGNKIIIPLKNTIVCIFNPSEEFPNIASVDDDGNRITLNLKENINVGSQSSSSPFNYYFNQESYKTDFKFLTDTSAFKNIPEKYKYTTITNENGEFILHDIPVGEQTFMFEVNMLKQGLTPDEVALNFFSYPLEEGPNVDKIPHYFFRQVPVNVLPSWGNSQTGYTQLDIKASIDLRKWSTYFISPIAYKTNTIEEMQASGIFSRLTCSIRDMTKTLDVNNRVPIELVEIQDVYDRNPEQEIEWYNEFKLKKNKVEFNTTRYNVFKLPANLYDPNGYNSKGQKGVWLCAYQIKMFYGNASSAYRATGFEREWITDLGAVGRNHFDLNKNADYGIITSTPVGKIGKFPYEKPWTINYPEPYKIPKQPNLINSNKTYDANGEPLEITEPLYLDGDAIGTFIPFGSDSGGYGLQDISGGFKSNKFSRELTKAIIYKYEDIDQWDEQYSNGFIPGIENQIRLQFGLPVSNVLNGEKWQRLESGFAYWLKPEGWPRIVNRSWGDAIITSDHVKNLNTPPKFGPSTYVDGIYKSREDILIRMDSSTPYWKYGALDIYRVSYPNKVLPPLVPPVEKFIKINLQDIIAEGKRFDDNFFSILGVGPQSTDAFINIGGGDLKIQNLGTTKSTIALGGEIKEIEPGASYQFKDVVRQGSSVILPANNQFDSSTNSYLKAKYRLTFWSVLNDANNGGHYSPGTGEVCYGGEVDIDLAADTESSIPNYFLISIIPVPVLLGGGLLSPSNSAILFTETGKSLAINGFAYCTYNHNFVFAQTNSVVTYYPNTPIWVPNPFLFIEPEPLDTPFKSFRNYPYGLL